MLRIKSKKMLNGTENGNSDLFRKNRNFDSNSFDGKFYINNKKLNENNSGVGGGRMTVIVIDPKLRAILILAAIIGILYKIFLLSMPVTASDRFIDISKYVQHRFEETWSWMNQPENRSNIIPIICGFIFALFSWSVVYLDSNIPGIDPPLPFSSKSKIRYRRQQKNAIHLGYPMAIISGILVTFLMLYKF